VVPAEGVELREGLREQRGHPGQDRCLDVVEVGRDIGRHGHLRSAVAAEPVERALDLLRRISLAFEPADADAAVPDLQAVDDLPEGPFRLARLPVEPAEPSGRLVPVDVPQYPAQARGPHLGARQVLGQPSDGGAVGACRRQEGSLTLEPEPEPGGQVEVAPYRGHAVTEDAEPLDQRGFLEVAEDVLPERDGLGR
jgi:hypothetical protein